MIQTLHSRNVSVTNLWHANFTFNTNLYQRLEVLERYTKRNDWIVLADSDEFHAFPTKIPEFLEGMEQKGYNVVMGIMQVRPVLNAPPSTCE